MLSRFKRSALGMFSACCAGAAYAEEIVLQTSQIPSAHGMTAVPSGSASEPFVSGLVCRLVGVTVGATEAQVQVRFAWQAAPPKDGHPEWDYLLTIVDPRNGKSIWGTGSGDATTAAYNFRIGITNAWILGGRNAYLWRVRRGTRNYEARPLAQVSFSMVKNRDSSHSSACKG